MRSAAIAALSIQFAASAAATPVLFTFNGHVTSVQGFTPTGASVGDLVSGQGKFDPAATDFNSGPNETFQIFSSGSAFLEINIHTNSGVLAFRGGPGVTAEAAYLWTWDQSSYPSGDYFQFSAYSDASGWPAALLGGTNEATLSFYDQLAPFSMLDGVVVPAGLPDLSQVTTQGNFVRSFGSSNFQINFDLTPVPEPGTGLLITAALLMIGGALRAIRS